MFKKSMMSVVGLLSLCACSSDVFYAVDWEGAEDFADGSDQLNGCLVFSFLQENIRHKVEKSFLALRLPYKVQVEEDQLFVFFDAKESKKMGEVERLLANQDVYFSDSSESVKEARKNWSQEQDLHLSPAYVELLDKSEKVSQGIFSKDLSVVQKGENVKSGPSSLFGNGYGARPGFMGPKQRMENGRNYDKLETEEFLSLPINEDDKNVIRQFVVNLNNRTVEELMSDREGLEALKQRLDSIHPLRLAGFIFSDPTTIDHARGIMNTDVKVNLFIILMQVEIQTSKENGSLDRYMPGFIDYLGLDSNVVWGYLNNMDYRGLIRYMLRM